MKIAHLIILLGLLLVTNNLFTQATSHPERGMITGRVTDVSNGIPVIYAHVLNRSLMLGTITNSIGEFSLPANESDSILISYVGYQNYNFAVEKGTEHYEIKLHQNITQLEPVTILPADDSYLYEVVNQCRNKEPEYDTVAKGYYELKSFSNNRQIELIEGYYNMDIAGYDLRELHLKAGRTALCKFQNRVFASLESSKAVLLFQTTKNNSEFPDSPLQLSKHKMKRKYYLQLQDAYLNAFGDSIFRISFIPKESSSSDYFEGTMWINKSNYMLTKINLKSDRTHKHPFIAIPKNDMIINAGFEITKSFETIDSVNVFHQVDFDYFVDYQSNESESTFRVNTRAVLYAYDFRSRFTLPQFDYEGVDHLDDYAKINSFPYNDYFWEHRPEPGLYDKANINQSFFEEEADLTSGADHYMESVESIGLFDRRFRPWSYARFKFENKESGLQNRNFKSMGFAGSNYNLSIKIFFDRLVYPDTIQIITRTSIDLHESFFDYKFDKEALCFINMYFDFYEICRRRLQEKLESGVHNSLNLSEIYDDFMKDINRQAKEFREGANIGSDKSVMLKYNAKIKDELKIDNLAVFGIAEAYHED